MGLLDTLVQTESGGNWGASNNVTGAGGLSGHFGRLQFGQARLQDAMRAGAIPEGITPQQFMADPAMQQRAERWHFSDIDQQAKARGLDRYLGQTVGGIPITQNSIRAMAHLGGIGGASKFLESGGAHNPADAYGTSLADYARKHGGSGDVMFGESGQETIQGQQGIDRMAQTTAPQAQQSKPSIWDNVPFLSDPDRRARLQIGLEGLTHNPNQALMQNAQQGIADRGDQAQKNETVAWLSQQPGGEQFAQAIAAGFPADQAVAGWMQSQQPAAAVKPVEVNGQLVDPTTGAVIGDYRTQEAADQTAAMQNYGFLVANGMSPDEAMGRAFSNNQTTVNVGPNEGAFSAETGKLLAQEAGAIAEAGATAQRGLGLVSNLRAALDNAPQGAPGALASLAGRVGIKFEGSSDLEAANALISQLVPQQRPPGSGTMSDADLALFKQSLPQLINTPEGNAKIIQTMESVLQYDVQRGEIARQLQLGKISPDEAFSAYAALGNPLAEYAKGLPEALPITAPSPLSDADLLKQYGITD